MLSAKALKFSTAVKKDPESGRFFYQSRGKIIYEWNQFYDLIILLVPKPADIPEEEVSCTIEEESLRLGQKGTDKAFFERPLGGKCDPQESIWVACGGAEVKYFLIHLKKAHPGVDWKRPLRSAMSASRHSTRKSMSSTRSYGKVAPEKGHVASGKQITEDQDIPLHTNGIGSNHSSHSVDHVLNQLDTADDDIISDEFYWGSSCSMPNMEVNPADQNEKTVDEEQPERQRRRAKKGSRQRIWNVTNPSLSPFASKVNLAEKRSLMSPSILKEKTLGFRTLFDGTIDAIAENMMGHESTAGSGNNRYVELDDGESILSKHKKEEWKQEKQVGEKPVNCEILSFSDLLAAAAPLPLDGHNS